MNEVLLALALMLSGALFFVQGRIWQERAVGPSVGLVWGSLPVGLRRIFTRSGAPPKIGPLPAQLWGLLAIAVGGLIVVGVIPPGRAAVVASFIVLGPGVIAFGVATFLTRFLRIPPDHPS